MPLCSLSDPHRIIFLKCSSKDALYLVRWSASAMMRAREGLVWMQDLFIVKHCLDLTTKKQYTNTENLKRKKKKEKKGKAELLEL